MLKFLRWQYAALVLVGLFLLGSVLPEDEKPVTAPPVAAASTPAAKPVATKNSGAQVSLKMNRVAAVAGDSVVVRGKVTDGSSVYVNDDAAEVEGRKWWIRVDLGAGTNDLTIDAEKSGLRSRTIERAIRRKADRASNVRKAKPASSKAPERVVATPSNTAGQSFSGNGRKNLGDIDVPVESVIEWTNASDMPEIRTIMISDDDFEIGVSSDATSGTSVLPAGTYKNVDVLGDEWTLTIRPR
jgi:hypothetical protein